MTLSDKLNSSLKEVMIKKDAASVAALRLLVAAVKNNEIEKKAPLTDEEVIQVLKTEAKKRQEAGEIYRQSGRPELAEREEAELKLIQEYLPAQMGQEAIQATVAAMKQAGELPADFGAAMKSVMAKLKGRADGRAVAEAVKAAL